MYNNWDDFYKEKGDIYKRLEPDFVKILKILKKNNVKKILDLGCGTGRYSIAFAKKGFEVVGLDYSKVGLSIAEQKANSENLRIQFILSDMSEIPFPNNYFDAIYCDAVIHHGTINKIEKTIEEIKRVLKPKGLFFSFRNLLRTGEEKGKEIEPHTFVELKGHPEGNVPHHFFKPEEFKKLLNDNNFDIETLEIFEKVKYDASEEWENMSFFNVISRKR